MERLAGLRVNERGEVVTLFLDPQYVAELRGGLEGGGRDGRNLVGHWAVLEGSVSQSKLNVRVGHMPPTFDAGCPIQSTGWTRWPLLRGD